MKTELFCLSPDGSWRNTRTKDKINKLHSVTTFCSRLSSFGFCEAESMHRCESSSVRLFIHSALIPVQAETRAAIHEIRHTAPLLHQKRITPRFVFLPVHNLPAEAKRWHLRVPAVQSLATAAQQHEGQRHALGGGFPSRRGTGQLGRVRQIRCPSP